MLKTKQVQRLNNPTTPLQNISKAPVKASAAYQEGSTSKGENNQPLNAFNSPFVTDKKLSDITNMQNKQSRTVGLSNKESKT